MRASRWWLLVSIGFRLYVQNFPGYSAVYGGIVGVILLLMWFYLSGFALLVGAELDGEIDKAMPTRDRTPESAERRKKIGPLNELPADRYFPGAPQTHGR